MCWADSGMADLRAGGGLENVSGAPAAGLTCVLLPGELRASENSYFCQAARQLASVPSSQLCVKLASGGDPTYAFNIRFTGEEVHGTSRWPGREGAPRQALHRARDRERRRQTERVPWCQEQGPSRSLAPSNRDVQTSTALSPPRPHRCQRGSGAVPCQGSSSRWWLAEAALVQAWPSPQTRAAPVLLPGFVPSPLLSARWGQCCQQQPPRKDKSLLGRLRLR